MVAGRYLEDPGEGVGMPAVRPLGAVHLHAAVEHAQPRARRVPEATKRYHVNVNKCCTG